MNLPIHTIAVSHPTKIVSGTIALTRSKSISNRALIINALSGNQLPIMHLATAKDTQILHTLLQTRPPVYDVGDAGTAFRFLTAYLAIQPQDCVLTGSPRLRERPIAPLVEALRTIGAVIEYVEQEGFAPLRIRGSAFVQQNNQLAIAANVSSQFISALLMIAPALPQGLTLTLSGAPVSVPYIQLTLQQLHAMGIVYQWAGNTIRMAAQPFDTKPFVVEADWSAASYYVAMAALSEQADITLEGLVAESWQGDSQCAQWATFFGVSVTAVERGVRLQKSAGHLPKGKLWEKDFSDTPDLAQTFIPLCAALGIKGVFTGLATLPYKETDRLSALQQVLGTMQCHLMPLPARMVGTATQRYYLLEGECHYPEGALQIPTYQDHRMAMGFAPLALQHPLHIVQPEVVKKSNPEYWEDMQRLGFVITNL